MNKVLAEAKRLYDLGWAIHWLHSRSKRPIESGWTSGPRKTWDELVKSYRPGLNVGVRLGRASRVKDNFLAVIDVDVKSKDERHGKEVLARLKQSMNGHNLPMVHSGRGNLSRHYYILAPTPVNPFRAARSQEQVKVTMPSVAPSKKEIEALTDEELARGVRLRPAWEISVMGEGQQVVLPPSIHPDSGKPYNWARDFYPDAAHGADVIEKLKPVVDNSGDMVDKPKPGPKTLTGFTVVPVELSWLPIDDKIKNMIVTGEGVEDRSSMLLPIATALFKAGLSRNEVLTVLTDPAYFIGKVGFDHAKTSNRERAANWVYRYSVAKVEKQTLAENVFAEPVETPTPLDKGELEKQAKQFEALHDWRLDLEMTANERVRGTLKNVIMILDNELGLDAIKRDTFANRDFFTRAAPWGSSAGAAITDDDVTRAKFWLSEKFGFEPPNQTISDAFTVVATNNQFDPVMNWLGALPPWDEVERLDTWLVEHFGAQGEKEYLAQVFRKWICAMVIRVYEPGTKFDWAPIFEGDQGVGKSSFGRLLVGDKYFLDQLPDLGDKDAALNLQGIWAVEMGELATLRKNEIEIVKGFLTRTVDKVRPPYGHRMREYPRRCVFFGTTNAETYLRDETGNRRFKPVKVGRLDFEALARDRDQLFAEALWLYRSGFETSRTLDLSGQARITEVEIQAEKMVQDESDLMADALQDFIEKELKKPAPERVNFDRVKLADLFGGDLSLYLSPPLRNWDFNSRSVQFAGRALKKLGAAKRIINGRMYWKIPVRR